MKRSTLQFLLCFATISVILCGCGGALVCSNIPNGTKHVPDGYGVIYGTFGRGGAFDFTELAKYSSLSIIRGQKTVGIANRSKSDPGIVFGFMVPAGQIHLKCSILNVKIPGTEFEDGLSYYTVWRKNAYYQCTSDIVNVQADTAVYVGHVHMFDKLDKTLRKGGLIGIKAEDWTEEYKLKDAAILVKIMFQINSKVERYRKLCNNHKVHLPKFTPENWRLEWPSEEEIKKARDNSLYGVVEKVPR